MDGFTPGSKKDRGRRGVGARGGKVAKRQAAKRRKRRGRAGFEGGASVAKVRSRSRVLEEGGDGADPECLWYALIAKVLGNRKWRATLVQATGETTDLAAAVSTHAHQPSTRAPEGQVLVQVPRRKGKKDDIYPGALVLVQLNPLFNKILETYTEAELEQLRQAREVPKHVIDRARAAIWSGARGSGVLEDDATGNYAFDYGSDDDEGEGEERAKEPGGEGEGEGSEEEDINIDDI